MIVVTTEQSYRIESEDYEPLEGEVCHNITEEVWEVFQLAENRNDVVILNNHPEFLTLTYIE